MTDLHPPAPPMGLDDTVRRPGARRRETFRRVATAIVLVVVLVGVGATARTALGSSPSRGHRTATVSTRTVDEVMPLVATVEPVSQASVAFPVAGTVSSVAVQPGDTVATGATLATLDTAALEDDVDAARADLDQAELTLERALDGEDVSAMPSGGGTPLTGGVATGISTVSVLRTVAAPAEDDEALRAAQQAVLDATSAVSTATSTAATALEVASTTCAAPDDGDDATDETAACRDALEQAFTAQQALTTAQTALTDAAAALTELLAERAEAPDDETDPTVPPTTEAPDPSTPEGGMPEGAAPDGGTTPDAAAPSGSAPSGSTPEGTEAATSSPTAEELIAYQKAVDAAAAQLTVAQQALGQARVVSPISGTVVSVGLATGDEVEAASATATVVVVSEGGYEVTALVGVDDLPDIEVGQVAHVQPDGDQPLVAGEVVRIGVTASSSSGASTTYPVTIGLTDQPSSLGNGSTATVEVVTDGATEAVAVPTSAVTATDGAYSVQVLQGSEVEEVEVEIGAIGDTWTEITNGVEVGDTVVLADLDEPLPGSATQSSAGAGGPDAAFPGGGFPGGPGG